MKHEIRTHPPSYARIKNGTKTFERTFNEGGFQMGDTVSILEWDPAPINPAASISPRGLTESPPLDFKIGFIEILPHDQVILSLLPLEAATAPQRAPKLKTKK